MKNRQATNYDALSRYYDALGTLVFAGALMRSQAHFLPYIPKGGRVLVVGGGTGKILERLGRVHPHGLHITYVELSEKMLGASRGRDRGNHSVTFIHSAMEDFQGEAFFDVAITPFLFDNFLPDKARAVHQKVDGMLVPDGYWLYTDFVDHRSGWRRTLLQSMYAFFGRTAHVEARQLPDMEPLFAGNYLAVEAKRFYAGVIEAVVYRKAGLAPSTPRKPL